MFLDRWRRVASSQLDRHRTTYLAPRGNPKTFRSASNLKISDASNGCDCSQTGDVRGVIWIGGSSSDGTEGLWKNSTIAARSNRDRGAIEPRSVFFQRHHISKRSENDQRLTRTSIEARSWPDRGPIVGLLEAKIADILKRNRSKIEADSKPIRKLRLHVMKPPPRRMETASTTAPSPTISGLILSLKTHVLLCSSTFDRLVKKLSEFRGRS